MKRITTLVALVTALACSTPSSEEGASDAWVGTITTEGDVTTVINESGSVWGGTATLVEEASIGVEAGADEYMFGNVTDVYVARARIYIVDNQVPAVRAYDLDGVHVATIGSRGEGPGQYRRPFKVAVDPSGRILVSDFQRVNVYREDGTVEPTTFPTGRSCCGNAAMFVDDTGRPWLPYGAYDCEACSAFLSVRAHDRDGPAGDMRGIPEFDFEPIQIPAGRFSITPPFAARDLWTVSPSGTIVAGVSDAYRFEVHHAGGEKLIVEGYAEPVPVEPDEADWHRRYTISTVRGDALAGWDGEEIPEIKQVFSRLVASVTGETWVVRQGPGVRQQDCVEFPREQPQEAALRPCWRDEPIVDAFGADGRYLGPVQIPDELTRHGFYPPPFIGEDVVVAVVADEAGTIMVKRYRLVLAEGGGG